MRRASGPTISGDFLSFPVKQTGVLECKVMQMSGEAGRVRQLRAQMVQESIDVEDNGQDRRMRLRVCGSSQSWGASTAE